MTLNLTIPQMTHTDFSPRITVIGVGGGGTNAVDNMIAANLQGVEFVVANTDAQQLMHSRADRRIQLGPHITQGLGAGAKPEIGKAAAEEAADELYRHLDGAHMVFITAGMGGGTGTGAAPVIARMARERNILTVGVVTKPFGFEGVRRARSADQGIEELQQYVDTLIVIPNQNLFRMANERTTWRDAFKMADQVLYMGVRGVTDLMMVHGLVNLDFADIRTVMAEMGKAMMGTGEAEGENRAIRAAEAAINNPLLEDTSMSGARGLLINITGGEDLTLFEVDQAANRIREEVDEEANVIFGSAVDETLAGRIRVSVVATGIDSLQECRTVAAEIGCRGWRRGACSAADPCEDGWPHRHTGTDLLRSRPARCGRFRRSRSRLKWRARWMRKWLRRSPTPGRRSRGRPRGSRSTCSLNPAASLAPGRACSPSRSGQPPSRRRQIRGSLKLNQPGQVCSTRSQGRSVDGRRHNTRRWHSRSPSRCAGSRCRSRRSPMCLGLLCARRPPRMEPASKSRPSCVVSRHKMVGVRLEAGPASHPARLVAQFVWRTGH